MGLLGFAYFGLIYLILGLVDSFVYCACYVGLNNCC